MSDWRQRLERAWVAHKALPFPEFVEEDSLYDWLAELLLADSYLAELSISALEGVPMRFPPDRGLKDLPQRLRQFEQNAGPEMRGILVVYDGYMRSLMGLQQLLELAPRELRGWT